MLVWLLVFAVVVFVGTRLVATTAVVLIGMHQLRTINYRVLGVVAGVIVGIEMALPSTTLTGLERPAPDAPVRQMGSLGVPTPEMTYQDVADSADWLWRLGMVSRSEVAERLVRDIEIIEDRIAGLGDASRRPFPREQNNERGDLVMGLALDGFRQALADLAAQFPADTIVAKDVDAYLSQTMQRTFDAQRQAVEGRYFALSAERAATASADPETAKADPAIIAQTEEARREWFAYLDASASFRPPRWTLGHRPREWHVDYRFPSFSEPVPLIMQEDRLPTHLFPATHVGPPPQGGAGVMMRRIWMAFTGYTRPTPERNRETRCGLQFVETQGGFEIAYLCETIINLLADYDLTGAGCENSAQNGQDVADLVTYGTHAIDGLCKESWIFPTISMVVTPHSLTIYPPNPTGSRFNVAPLSDWQIDIDGQQHPLPHRTTRVSDSEKLPHFTLVHDVKPQVQHPRIWGDFAADRPVGRIDAAISSAAPGAHDYIPLTFADPFGTELSPAMMGFFALAQPQAARQQRLATHYGAFRAQRLVLEVLAGRLKHNASLTREATADQINSDFCMTSWLPRDTTLGTSRADAKFSLLAAASQAPTCEAYYAIAELNRQAELAAEEGTWLWLVETP